MTHAAVPWWWWCCCYCCCRYEWVVANEINHTMDAVRAMQYTADFLGSEVRKSHRQFHNTTLEEKSLIYSHLLPPNPTGDSFQYYVFGAQGRSLLKV